MPAAFQRPDIEASLTAARQRLRDSRVRVEFTKAELLKIDAVLRRVRARLDMYDDRDDAHGWIASPQQPR
jgi:hypothetical protein